jgi:hypothetical protein
VYASNPAFDNVVPIPQDDGPHPLAQIAYSEHYAEAMSYLRALMVGGGEMSERALLLTGDIIAMNPAHYTIWCVTPYSPSYPPLLFYVIFCNCLWVHFHVVRRGNCLGRTELGSYLH